MLRVITTTFLALALAACAFAGLGSVVSSFKSLGGYGLAWDGSYLWVWGVSRGWVFLRVTTTGSVVSSFGSGRYCTPDVERDATDDWSDNRLGFEPALKNYLTN